MRSIRPSDKIDNLLCFQTFNSKTSKDFQLSDCLPCRMRKSIGNRNDLFTFAKPDVTAAIARRKTRTRN